MHVPLLVETILLEKDKCKSKSAAWVSEVLAFIILTRSIFQILTYPIWAFWVYISYLFIKCVTKSVICPLGWFNIVCHAASSSLIETVSCEECFQKYFSAKNMISLLLNTVIPIIVMVWLSKLTRCLHRSIIYRHSVLVTFNVGVLSNAYHVSTQSRLFIHDDP